MKNLIFLLSILFSSSLFAQVPDSGSRSFSFGVNGLQVIGVHGSTSPLGTMLFKKYLASGKARRYFLSFNTDNTFETREDKAGGNKTTYTNYGFGLSLGYGCQRNLGNAGNKLNPYWGMDFSIGTSFYRNSSRNETVNADTTSDPLDKNGDYTLRIQHSVTPLTIGVYPFIGISYPLIKNLAIGAEFSYAANVSYTLASKSTTESKVHGTEQPTVKEKLGPNSFNLGLNTFTRSLIMATVFF